MNRHRAPPPSDGMRWLQLSRLVDDLLELEPGPQVSRLLELRQSDPALAEEASQWLAAGVHAERAGFLVGAPPPGPGAFADSGVRVGAYRLLQPIGRGSSGSVWRAVRAAGGRDTDAAVKLAHRALAGMPQAARFAREATILARLGHPHIAQLFEAGVTPDGRPYLVLELVVGERIDRHCDRRRLPIAARVELFLQVCAAVAHAHRCAVVHGDLKPANILVDLEGRVKLLDFGLARLLEAPAAAGASGADAGVPGLTPTAAAPEQLRGEAPTTASDVYALGVLLYRLLAGGHPVAPEAATPAQALCAVLGRRPRTLWRVAGAGLDAVTAAQRAREHGEGDLRRWRVRLRGSVGARGALDAVARRAVQRDPAQRHASVEAFAEAVRRHGSAAMASAHLPAGARATPSARWRARAAALVSTASRAVARALAWAVDRACGRTSSRALAWTSGATARVAAAPDRSPPCPRPP